MAGFFWRLDDYLAASDSDRQPNNYIAGNDGNIYSVRDNQFGRIVVKAKHVPKVDKIEEGFQFRLPKIPGSMLTKVISFFHAYWNKDEQNEVMIRIVYDTLEMKYSFDCPEQYVTRESIHAPTCGINLPEPRFIDLMHIHSHHIMPAIFSEIDDANELKYRLYMVVGNMSASIPDMSLRVGHNGSFIYIPLEVVFDMTSFSLLESTYPEEWDNFVTIV
ncbi:hypothetical protein [Paenibacillus sp. FSL P4-0288]|uniref:hypothetical protein n=1 Tax=Paenibacillus sp. FSL P4-0288 TaxID=2921633 RepID=UPI0030F94B58